MTGDRKLSPFQMLALGLLLFAMFLGAGNTIFAPMVGQAAGSSMWIPMSGFLITGVGLVLLAIIALTMAGGTVEQLASRVHPAFSFVFCLLLFLALGPLYVNPRTTSVVYEISVKPILGAELTQGPWALIVFSVIFTLLGVYLSLTPSKLVDRVGKVITPIFSVLLIVIVVKSLVTPMGELHDAVDPYKDGAFIKGFTEGYLTMDALAALVFAGVFIQSIRGQGITTRKGVSLTFLKAGIITIIGLALLHISLAWIGGSSVDSIGRPDNGGTVISEAARTLLGYPGVLMIGLVILLTGITTLVACLTAVADFFAKRFPKVSYKTWVWIHAAAGLVFANFGLEVVLSAALPILFLLYPLGMTLIVLALFDRFFGGRRAVYIGATIGAAVIAILDAVKAAGVLVDELNGFFTWLPMFEDNGGWILPAILGGVIGYFVARAKGEPAIDRTVHIDVLPDGEHATSASSKGVTTV